MISTFIAIGGMFYIVWIIKRDLPKRLKEEKEINKEEWEAQRERIDSIKKKNEEHQTKINEKINENQKAHKKAVFEKNRKTRAKEHYKNSAKKGKDYELYITDYFNQLGYKTKPFGILNGRKDKGVDVIIKKDKEITLIQCKNWKADSKYKITHTHLKEFLGNTTAFLENNKEKAEGYTIKKMFITSNDILDNSARHFLNENSIVEHKVIPMET